MHANRGTFYAVGKGIGEGRHGEKLSGVLLALKELWVELTFGGEEGIGRPMVPGDLDFLVSMDDLVSLHLEWLVKLGTPLWEVHFEVSISIAVLIERMCFFHRIGVKYFASKYL